MANYRNTAAVKQKDEFACWAACMKWWFKAHRNIYKSQTNYINNYIHLTNDEGAITPAGMKTFIQLEGLRVDEPSSMQFTIAKLKDHLQHSPLIAAYTTPEQTLHVNVIYELENEISGGNERYSQVRVMEPQAFQPNGTWRGKHQTKSFGEFTWWGTCMIGSLRP